MTGLMLFDELRQAARRGVRVRLLVDDNGTSGMDENLAALDADPNVEVRIFNPFVLRKFKPAGLLVDFNRLNRRMHNKSLTVDGVASIVGGRNIGDPYFDTDEHVRSDATSEGMAKLRAVFAKENGTVTAGNASGINDAAAAVVLMEAAAAQRANVKPMARLVSYGHAGIDPKIMGLGPVSAVKAALKKAGLRISDIDVIESNEAFAAQALGVNRELDLDPAKVNPNGGAVALGHPIGATGCILTVKAMYELARTNKRYGLVTMCIGGGQGIAAIIERI